MSDKVENMAGQEKFPKPKETFLLKRRREIILLIHIGVFALALFLSFTLARNMQISMRWLALQYPAMLMLVLLVKIPVFAYYRQYSGWWRYVGISDLITMCAASLTSTIIIVTTWYVMLSTTALRRALQPLTTIDQSIVMLDLFCTIMLIAALRMAVRLYHEEFKAEKGSKITKLIIVGAGDAGEALLREIHRMKVELYDVVGFIDDDPAKQKTSIRGIPILGTVEQLPEICKSKAVEEIAIAMPSASQKQLRRVVQTCQGTKLRFRTVPSITDIASGKLMVSQIRDVEISDLLGRKEVSLDIDLISQFLHDKVILVTGAGGSIGSEMCRQVCTFGPKLLLLVEQAENPLFFIEGELKKKHAGLNMKAIICDIADRTRVDHIFQTYKPDVVIHAAAHKHVPLMETNPGEAFKNNVAGTMAVADMSDKYEASSFVMISTDKAVNPTSLMGSSKRIAEMYVQNLNRKSKTHFVTVRFGNVLGSNGSVIPIFKEQIAKGGPVTVTHPEMKRYFMTIPEASQLVLQAATMGQGGEIFVLDMGEPVKIVDLARELITLSGFRPGEDIEIQFSGVRPGEKLFEELSIEGENMKQTRHPKIGIWENKPIDQDKLMDGIINLLNAAQNQNHDEVVEAVKKLIPEYIGDTYQC